MPVIKIPFGLRVLVVEDRTERQNWFLKRIPHAIIADLAHLANQAICARVPDVVFLDYDLHRFTSEETAILLAAMRFRGRIYIHSLNGLGPERLGYILEGLQVSVTPFGTFEIRIDHEEPIATGDSR